MLTQKRRGRAAEGFGDFEMVEFFGGWEMDRREVEGRLLNFGRKWALTQQYVGGKGALCWWRRSRHCCGDVGDGLSMVEIEFEMGWMGLGLDSD